MGTAFALTHFLGIAVAMWTFNARAGGSFWHGVPPRLMLISPEWTAVSIGKAFLWEVTPAVWLLGGRPSSPWGVRAESRSGRVTRLSPAERAARDRATTH
ncbi:hypothetical protein [Streptomyces sp. LaPpAH-108]|uniref:hypothetical protein n=1 Tax=Streptomyces sp. LaPpAH-108 TaxID=1155714 RepID=UPI000360C709|nr:hypothetical protein [Streptomyces sp. LaPpAH-108]